MGKAGSKVPMNSFLWIKLANEAIPFIFLIALSVITYRGLRKNQFLLSEREDLLRRYLLFRSDKHVRLKAYGQDDHIRRELLRTLSNSWKTFKKAYDQYQVSLLSNTARAKVWLQLITLGLFINSSRRLIEEYYFYGFEDRFFLVASREIIYYVLVGLSFFLLKVQARFYPVLNGKAGRVDLETLFSPDHLASEKEHQNLYNEFEPLDGKGVEDGEEDQDYHQRAEGRGAAE